ncbi:hypothetical protein BY458DRAFT_521010 [Sporodiniella umbellata]|nr:hypothetical protein BY458DRAFT_521010 [Sporodiniella umbellata]
MSPEILTRGEKVNVELKGVLPESVPEGSMIDVTIKMGLFTLYTLELDFCESIRSLGESCPFPKGKFSFKKSVSIPLEKTVPGKFTIRSELKMPDKRRISCLVSDVQVI